MTGSMYAAIAGLKTHMNKLNVIGHNVANVNTQGYKSQRTVFEDAMYTMYRSGSNGTTVVGGRNPAQIGYGSQVSTIDLNMGSGSYQPGSTMDCMIDGDGFFLVGNKEVADVIDATNPNSFKSLSLSRVGNFNVGPDGYLVDGKGGCIYGFLTTGYTKDGDPIVSDQLVPIRMPRQEKVPYGLTGDNKDKELTQEQIADLKEGTDFEYRTVIRYPVTKAAGNGTTTPGGDNTRVVADKLDDYWPAEYTGENAQERPEENPLPYAQMDSISFDSNTGAITGTTKDTGENVVIGYLAIGTVTNPNGVTHTGGHYFTCGPGAGDLSITLLGGAAKTLTINENGDRMAYVNGSRVPLTGEGGADGAAGTDPYLELSDKARISSAGETALNTNGLEGSNVDLATEISDMITTQRGYQANTRIITVTDTMLEELVNMKR